MYVLSHFYTGFTGITNISVDGTVQHSVIIETTLPNSSLFGTILKITAHLELTVYSILMFS